MVQGTKYEELLFSGVPVSSKSTKDSGTIVEGVGENADVGFLIGNDVAFEERVIR
jgi:hypothetical protein